MIKIISGTYGYREGNKITPKNAGSPAFSLSPEKETRLVRAGVAMFVGQTEEAEQPSLPNGSDSNGSENEELGGEGTEVSDGEDEQPPVLNPAYPLP